MDARWLAYARAQALQNQRAAAMAAEKAHNMQDALHEAAAALERVDTKEAERGRARVTAAMRAAGERHDGGGGDDSASAGAGTKELGAWCHRARVVVESLAGALTTVQAHVAVECGTPADPSVERAMHLLAAAGDALANLAEAAPAPSPADALRAEAAGARAIAGAHLAAGCADEDEEDDDDDDDDEAEAAADASTSAAATEVARSLADKLVRLGPAALTRRAIEKAARHAVAPLVRREAIARRRARTLASEFACARAGRGLGPARRISTSVCN